MDKIYKLEDLYNIIDQNYNSKQDFLKLPEYVKNYCGEDWKNYISLDMYDLFNSTPSKKILDFHSNVLFNDDYNIIYTNNYKFEMFLLCWTPDQSSKIDDHSKNGCIMKVLDGNINETLYDYKLNILNEYNIKQNYVSVINYHIGQHLIKTPRYAVSLHILVQ